MFLRPANQARFDRLRSLTPLAAIQAMLEGDFGIGDEPAIAQAVHKDKRITLSDDDIIDFLRDAILEENCDAQKCLEELINRSRPPDSA